MTEDIAMEPVHPGDLKTLLLFAFAAALGKHPDLLTEDEKRRWKDFCPTPRSVFQRVDHALYAKDVVPFQDARAEDDGFEPSVAAYKGWLQGSKRKTGGAMIRFKKLEWKEHRDGDYLSVMAKGLAGRYDVWKLNADSPYRLELAGQSSEPSKPYGSLEEAQAAAQTHYDEQLAAHVASWSLPTEVQWSPAAGEYAASTEDGDPAKAFAAGAEWAVRHAQTGDEKDADGGPFHVSRSSDGQNEWFSARDAASGVAIPLESRGQAAALVESLNRAVGLHVRLATSKENRA